MKTLGIKHLGKNGTGSFHCSEILLETGSFGKVLWNQLSLTNEDMGNGKSRDDGSFERPQQLL